MPSPTPGASIGTTIKTMVTKDITRDISRPSKRSRTMASEITRGAAAPMPCKALAARRPANEAGGGGEQGAANIEREPEQQWRLASEPVRERAEYELAYRKSAEINADDELPVVAVCDAQRAANLRQRGQHDVHAQGGERHEGRHQRHKFKRGKRELSRAVAGLAGQASGAWRGFLPIIANPETPGALCQFRLNASPAAAKGFLILSFSAQARLGGLASFAAASASGRGEGTPELSLARIRGCSLQSAFARECGHLQEAS